MVIRYTKQPKFRLDSVHTLVQAGMWDYMNYDNRTARHLDDYGWSDADVGRILMALRIADFQKTVANCAVKEPWCPSDRVTADQYRICWNAEAQARAAWYDQMALELSIKISIVRTDADDYVGLVTFHPSGSPW